MTGFFYFCYMLLFIVILLIVLGSLYLLAIVKMSSQKHFFKTILVHTIVFVSYAYIAQNFEKIFQMKEVFGYHKLEFLMFCMSLQIFIGYYLVQSKHRQRKIREFLGLQKKTKNETDDNLSKTSDSINK